MVNATSFFGHFLYKNVRKRWNKILKIMKKILVVFEGILITLVGLIAAILWSSAKWMFKTWPYLNMDELVYQLNAPMEGTNVSMVKEYIQFTLPTAVLALFIIIILLLAVPHGRNKAFQITACSILAVSITVIAGTGYYTYDRLDIKNYSKNQGTYSTFIDTNYQDPSKVKITFPEQKRNLIYIYLESVEATYTNKENGGGFDVDYMPELTAIAQENEDFSGADSKLNGGLVMPGSTWTVAAMFGQSAGIPLNIPVSGNSMDQQESFLPKVTAIGDILAEAGYNQTLFIGSDATFGGRRQLFTDHGHYNIKDYKYALEEGLIPPEYWVWWGYEDQKLFANAKNELLELAAREEPFNFTLLTVDTHFEDGYYCEICKDIHNGDNYANVISCASKQVAEFVEWIQQQSFYENTTIVISGDHLTMDSDFCIEVDKDTEYERKVYTTYINPAAEVKKPDVRREYTTYDNFPTTLASLGVSIEGERLGLGTNLFSDEYTLVELYGKERIKSEIQRKSKLMEEFTSDIITDEERELLEKPTAEVSVGEHDSSAGTLPLYITNIDDKGKGVSGINVAIWVEEDQSDMQWMQAELQADGTYMVNILVPNFNYKTGYYKIDAHLLDTNGEAYLVGSTTGYVE